MQKASNEKSLRFIPKALIFDALWKQLLHLIPQSQHDRPGMSDAFAPFRFASFKNQVHVMPPKLQAYLGHPINSCCVIYRINTHQDLNAQKNHTRSTQPNPNML